MDNTYNDFYDGIERRITMIPRRLTPKRRHRRRTESLVCDCRSMASRRYEDKEEVINTYVSEIEERLYWPLNPK